MKRRGPFWSAGSINILSLRDCSLSNELLICSANVRDTTLVTPQTVCVSSLELKRLDVVVESLFPMADSFFRAGEFCEVGTFRRLDNGAA